MKPTEIPQNIPFDYFTGIIEKLMLAAANGRYSVAREIIALTPEWETMEPIRLEPVVAKATAMGHLLFAAFMRSEQTKLIHRLEKAFEEEDTSDQESPSDRPG